MSEVLEDHQAKLQRFFIFNSSWGPNEGEEEEKIVFYHPKEDTEKTKHVGLIEALVRFMSVFSENPAEIQHCQKSKAVFKEVESGFWLVLDVAVPYKIKQKNESRESNYYGEKLHDNVLQAKLQRSYDLFKLFTGGFQESQDSREAIKAKSAAFFGRFLQNNFNFSENVQLNLAGDLFGAVQFLTLEPLDFLHVLSFVNKVESDFACVDKTLFFHHGNIVWSGLQQHETQLLFHYVYSSLLPSSGSSKTGSASSLNSPFGNHQGRFLTGPTATLKLTPDQFNSLRIPKVFVPFKIEETGEEILKEYHFLVYHALRSTLCLLIPIEVDFTMDFFKRLDGHLGPRLTNMSADLFDVFGRSSTPGNAPDPSILSPTVCVNPSLVIDSIIANEDLNMVYYNDANKAMKNTTPVATGMPGKSTAQDNEIQHALSDLNEDILDLEDVIGKAGGKMTSEMTAKLSSEDWLVAKKIDQRQLYLALKGRANSNLLDISDEVSKVMASEFKIICLPP